MSRIPYEPHEDEVIKTFYPIGGYEMCMPKLPGRTRLSIVGRAKTMRVHVAGRKKADRQLAAKAYKGEHVCMSTVDKPCPPGWRHHAYMKGCAA